MGIVISIGFADSLNPTTIAPALYLASGERPRERVIEFTVAVFAVYLLGGVLIALGPGQLILSLVPHPSHEAREVLEVIAGAVMIAAGIMLWRHRDRLASRALPEPDTERRSSAVLGATITAFELPTAFPYFAAIAAIVGSGVGPAKQVALLVLFNFCFVAPLAGILGMLWVAGDQATERLARLRNFLLRRWPVLLAGAALIAGTFTILLGTIGIADHSHGRIGRFLRHFGKILHLH
jgi:cytochrome c biogenesis protein CcdA